MMKAPFLLLFFLLSSCALDARSVNSSELTVLFAGDTHLGENYQEKLEENILEMEGYDYSFKNFDTLLSDVDWTIVNLETPLTHETNSILEGGKEYIHWSDPERAVETFMAHKLDVFSLANNHSMDFGVKGLEDTQGALKNAGLETFGAGLNENEAGAPFTQTWTLSGEEGELMVVGTFEYRETYQEDYDFYADEEKAGVYELNLANLQEKIQKLKAENPKAFVVIFPHWGDNYKPETEEQKEMAHALIDAGADLIVGHGAHVAQAVENYKDHWIVYNLGNFVFNAPGRYQKLNVAPYSFLAVLHVELKQKILRIYPIFTDNLITNYQSRFVTKMEFEDIQNLHQVVGVETGKDRYGYYFDLPL